MSDTNTNTGIEGFSDLAFRVGNLIGALESIIGSEIEDETGVNPIEQIQIRLERLDSEISNRATREWVNEQIPAVPTVNEIASQVQCKCECNCKDDNMHAPSETPEGLGEKSGHTDG